MEIKKLLSFEYFNNFRLEVSLLDQIFINYVSVRKTYNTKFVGTKILKKIYFIHCA